MKRSLRNSRWLALSFVLLMAGCSAPPDNGSATSNNNAPASATANANATAVTGQPATPPVATAPPAASPTPAVQPVPATQPMPATVKPTETAAKPAAKENKESAAPVSGPKLVLVTQEKDLDFGKQPQDKTLVKAIRIKNGGKAVLNIQSVTPS